MSINRRLGRPRKECENGGRRKTPYTPVPVMDNSHSSAKTHKVNVYKRLTENEKKARQAKEAEPRINDYLHTHGSTGYYHLCRALREDQNTVARALVTLQSNGIVKVEFINRKKIISLIVEG